MITSTNLKIRKTRYNDIDDIYKLSNNNISNKDNLYLFNLDKNEINDILSNDKTKCFSVYNKNTKEYIGQINYDILSTLNEYKLCDLKFIFNLELCNEKLIIEAFITMLEYMINVDSCIKIMTNVLVDDLFFNDILLKCDFSLVNKNECIYNNKNTFINNYKITKPMFKNRRTL